MCECQFGNNIFEGLLMCNYDEVFFFYGLIVQWVCMLDICDWIEFEFNLDVCFFDGFLVIVEDVIFLLEIIEEKGCLFFWNWYVQIKDKIVSELNCIKLVFENGDNCELLLLIVMVFIFFKKYIDVENFDKLMLILLVGSGFYMFEMIEFGCLVVYKKNFDYWVKDLVVIVGFGNFDQIWIEYYCDEIMLQEVFKKGFVDILQFCDFVCWLIGFDFLVVENGDVIKLEILCGVLVLM